MSKADTPNTSNGVVPSFYTGEEKALPPTSEEMIAQIAQARTIDEWHEESDEWPQFDSEVMWMGGLFDCEDDEIIVDEDERGYWDTGDDW